MQSLLAVRGFEGAVETGDNARAHRAIKAQGIANDKCLIADVHRMRIPQRCGHKLRRRLAGVQDGDVILGLPGDHLRTRLAAIREYELNVRGVGNNM